MNTVKKILKDFINNTSYLNFKRFEYQILDIANPDFISGFTLEDYNEVQSLYDDLEVESYNVNFDEEMITLFLK